MKARDMQKGGLSFTIRCNLLAAEQEFQTWALVQFHTMIPKASIYNKTIYHIS